MRWWRHSGVGLLVGEARWWRRELLLVDASHPWMGREMLRHKLFWNIFVHSNKIWKIHQYKLEGTRFKCPSNFVALIYESNIWQFNPKEEKIIFSQFQTFYITSIISNGWTNFPYPYNSD